MFSRIMYITVFVSDQSKALDFYTSRLGFQKRADYTGPDGRFPKMDGRPTLTISLSCDETGLVSDIFVTLNPDKLARLDPVEIH